MNRNCYRLVFNPTLGAMVPAAETARRMGKAASSTVVAGVMLAGVVLSPLVSAEMPNQSAVFATQGSAATQTLGNRMNINQVGNAAILNWQSFNLSAGNTVQFRQVDNLTSNNLVQGANFTTLNRIHDINPSVIAGNLTQGAGQKADVIMVNSNGIAFMGTSRVNLNSFSASTLNMRDSLVVDGLLSGANNVAQFENALDGGPARGFIKVFEGAQIAAGQFGRVMLIAPTVTNKGTITAPDGQTLLAASSRVFLRAPTKTEQEITRGLLVEVDVPTPEAGLNADNTTVQDGLLDGNAVALRNAAEDKLGHVTNLGQLQAARGNVTMVGYAVNQKGVARATTSVVANGSIFLVAQHTDKGTDNSPGATAGRVVLGAGSLTEVAPELDDKTGAVDGVFNASVVQVRGQDIRMEGAAAINARAGKVEVTAVDNVNDLSSSTRNPLVNPLTESQGITYNAPSDKAVIHIASGAKIDVSGLDKVEVSAARNSVRVELRGDELKDSPVNRDPKGPLRGETVYVDIDAALTNAQAGKSTLIANDSLLSYKAQLTRDIAERSTQGGSVKLQSQGEMIVERGATIDLSGGSVKYTGANLKTTLLTTNGRTVDIADATADNRYDGIATRIVIGYGKWNQKEVIDLGQSNKYDPGYTQGKDAGSLNLVGMKAVVMQGDIQGRTTTGERQAAAGVPRARHN